MFRHHGRRHSGPDLAYWFYGALGCAASGRLPVDLLQLISPRDAPHSPGSAQEARCTNGGLSVDGVAIFSRGCNAAGKTIQSDQICLSIAGGPF